MPKLRRKSLVHNAGRRSENIGGKSVIFTMSFDGPSLAPNSAKIWVGGNAPLAPLVLPVLVHGNWNTKATQATYWRNGE